MKILSIHDLATIRKRAEHNLSLREESNEKVTEKCYGLASGAQHLQILICGGTGCKASSSQGITDNLLKAIKKNEITDKVEVITVGCFGFCEKGPRNHQRAYHRRTKNRTVAVCRSQNGTYRQRLQAHGFLPETTPHRIA